MVEEPYREGQDVYAYTDWGFWKAYNRRYMNEFFENQNIDFEWHYIKVDDSTWEKNIAERNEKINKGQNKTDFFVNEINC